MQSRLFAGLTVTALVAAGATAIEAPPAVAAPPSDTITVGSAKFGIAVMPDAVFTTDAVDAAGAPPRQGDLVRRSLSGSGTTVIAGPAQNIGRTVTNKVSASAYRVMSDGQLRYGAGVPKSVYGFVEVLSGTRAVVAAYESLLYPHYVLYDVRTGVLESDRSVAPWRVGPVDLFGNYLVYARDVATGTQVRRRDLSTGKEVLVWVVGRPGVQDVAVNGNLVAWVTRCHGAPCPQRVSYRTIGATGALGPVKSFGTRGTRSIDLSATHLALDTVTARREVRLVTLGSHTIRVIGSLPADQGAGTTAATGDHPDHARQVPVHFDLDNDRIAWLDANQNAKVTALGTPPARARYLGNGLIMPWFTPNGDGRYDHFGASLPFSKNLTRCAVTFRKGTTAVRTVPCLVRNGDVLIIWDGRNSAGRLVPKGRYQWTLTGSDAAGPALWYTGSGARIGATVEVR